MNCYRDLINKEDDETNQLTTRGMSVNRECAVGTSPAPGIDIVICKQVLKVELNNLNNENGKKVFYTKRCYLK